MNLYPDISFDIHDPIWKELIWYIVDTDIKNYSGYWKLWETIKLSWAPKLGEKWSNKYIKPNNLIEH